MILVLAFIVSSCSKENIDQGDIDIDQPDPTTITQNPLVTRGGGGGEGLDLDCFTIKYPFGLINDVDETITITADEDLELLEFETIVDFDYPVDVVLEDGTEDSVDNAESLSELFASCIPSGGWNYEQFPAYLIDSETSCYEIVYPIQVENEAGEITDIESSSDLSAAVSTEIVYFVFPFSLVDQETNELTSVGDVDELFDALIACNGDIVSDTTNWEWEYGFEYIGCYTIAFPFNVVLQSGETITVEDHMQYCDLLLSGDVLDFAFPMTLIDVEGNTIVVADQGELDVLLEECDEWIGGAGFEAVFQLWSLEFYFNSDGTPCHTINYPISISMIDGAVVEVNNIQELEEIVLIGNPFEIESLEYPVSVTKTSDQTVTEFNSDNEVFEFEINCD